MWMNRYTSIFYRLENIHLKMNCIHRHVQCIRTMYNHVHVPAHYVCTVRVITHDFQSCIQNNTCACSVVVINLLAYTVLVIYCASKLH